MSVIKVKILKGFTILANVVLENPRLSFKAKGLWAYCMSRKEDWEFYVEQLATVSKDKEKAIYTALEELIVEGLVTKTQKIKGKGERKGREGFEPVEYTVYPFPQEVPKEIKEKIAHRRFVRAQKAALLRTDPNKKHSPSPRSSPSLRSVSSSSSSLKEKVKKRMIKEKKEPPTDQEYEESLKRMHERPKEDVKSPLGWLAADIESRRGWKSHDAKEDREAEYARLAQSPNQVNRDDYDPEYAKKIFGE